MSGCSTDGRSWEAVLADVRLRRLRQAWPTLLASVRRHATDHLGEVDQRGSKALQRLATEVETGDVQDPPG